MTMLLMVKKDIVTLSLKGLDNEFGGAALMI